MRNPLGFLGFLLLFFAWCFLCSLETVESIHDDGLTWLLEDEDNAYRRVARSAKAFRSINNDNRIIPPDYNLFETPPTINGSSNLVNFSIIVMSVRGINEKDEELTMEMNLRMFWVDSRLSELSEETEGDSFLVLNPSLLMNIWHPDVFIDHAISVSQPALITKPASLRIYPNNVIRFSARLLVTMACKMDFHFYPLDTQRCYVQLKSYAYPTKIVELAWQQRRGAFMAKQLNLPNFDVELEKTTNFTTQTSSGNYSNLEIVLKLDRKLSYHLIQTYLPSSIFLIVSWLSFLIPKESVPERIGSCMMTLLTLTVMFGSVGQSMPKVSYLTALDIWMVTCIVFVFMALIEFTVVLKLWSLEISHEKIVMKPHKRGYEDNMNRAMMMDETPGGNGPRQSLRLRPATTKFRGGNEDLMEPGQAGDFSPSSPTPMDRPHHHHYYPHKYLRWATKLETITIMALPSLFLVFNFVYWPWLLFVPER